MSPKSIPTTTIKCQWLDLPRTNTDEQQYHLAIITLDRPKVHNAFNRLMMEELTEAFTEIGSHATVRVVVLQSSGKHFSAGADLNWMRASAQLTAHQDVQESRLLQDMFEALSVLSVPTIALVDGAAYGGAMGLIAACDITLATARSRFCLSEVKLGLLPAVILPYLGRRMGRGALQRYSLSGRAFDADEAKNSGLIDEVFESSELAKHGLRSELAALLHGSKSAQGQLKKLLGQLAGENWRQSDLTINAISTARQSVDGQAGLDAFFHKTTPPWLSGLDKNGNLADDLQF